MRQSLLTVALLVLVAIAWMLRDLVMLVGFAALFAYALDPVVSWVERGRLPGRRSFSRGWAAALVILVIVLVGAAALVEAVPRLVHQLVRFAGSAPATLARLEEQARVFVESLGWGNLLGSAEGETSSNAASVLNAVQHGLLAMVSGVLRSAGSLAVVILVPLFTFYMLANREGARSTVLGMVPADRLPQAERFLNAFERALRAYVRGQTLVCLVMGAVMAAVLGLLGVPVALLLGVVVALAEIVPIVGFWIAAIAIALEGYSKTPGLALAGVVAYVLINSLIQTFVSPRLLGRQVKLHPFVVNVAVIGGAMLLGPAGGILALPAAAIAKALLDEFGPRRSGANAAATGATRAS